MTPDAWVVIDPQGNRSVYLDEAHALSYAVRVHGIVQPRYPYELDCAACERSHDALTEPDETP